MQHAIIRTRFWIPALAAVAIASLSFVACGGSDDEQAPEPTATSAAVATDVPPAPTEPSTDSITIGADFWHAGWRVTLGEATLGPDDFGIRTVSIDAVFENLSNGTSTFNSQLALISDGSAFGDMGIAHDLPSVPAGLSAGGLLSIQVDDVFSLDDATLIVGNPDNNRAVVPIGPDSPDDLVSLEPVRITVDESAAAGPVSFTVTGVEVRADLPDWSDEVEEGRLAMIVSFEVTVGTGIPIGEGVFQSQNVALVQPDGTAVAVRSDGRSGVNELLQGKEGTTIQDLSVRFIIDSPAEGEYAFLVRGPYGPDREQVEGDVTFVVPAS